MDQNGNHTYYDYDDDNRVIEPDRRPGRSEQSNRLVTYSYDPFGNRQGVTTYVLDSTGNPVGRQTVYTYDANNRVTKIVYPDSAAEGDLIRDEFFQDDPWAIWWRNCRDRWIRRGISPRAPPPPTATTR